MSQAPVRTTRRGPVLHIRLNRPAVRNAIDQAMAEGVAAALDQLDATPELGAAVLDGAAPSFCSGMDLQAYQERGERPVVADRGLLGFARRPPAKPLLAAVEGHALGAGFEAVLSCDLVVAAEDAIFGLPEVQRGLLAGGGGTMHLARHLPKALASDVILTGRRLTGVEAAHWGLVSRVTPAGHALETAVALAELIAEAPKPAVATAREVIRRAPDWSSRTMWQHQEPHLQRMIAASRGRGGTERGAGPASPTDDRSTP